MATTVNEAIDVSYIRVFQDFQIQPDTLPSNPGTTGATKEDKTT